MTGIGLKTQTPGGIHKPRIIFLIIAIFVLVTKQMTYPSDSFPSPGDLVLTPLVYATVNPMRVILGQKKRERNFISPQSVVSARTTSKTKSNKEN